MAKQEVAEVNQTSNLPASIQQEILELQKRVQAPTGSRISVMNNGKFKVPGIGEVEGPIDVIVVQFAAANYLYKGAYRKDNPQPPVCAAVGKGTNDDLIPAENAPEIQADDCKTCPMNQFGSNGNGKACKNMKMVALLPADAGEGNESDIMTISVSPTGIKDFDSTISKIAGMGRLPRQLVMSMYTKAAGNSDAKTVAFGDPRPLTDEQFAYVNSRLQDAENILLAPPKFD